MFTGGDGPQRCQYLIDVMNTTLLGKAAALGFKTFWGPG